jgi:TRAP-type C4-dicarboxylate transport system permease small subunit
MHQSGSVTSYSNVRLEFSVVFVALPFSVLFMHLRSYEHFMSNFRKTYFISDKERNVTLMYSC